MRENLFDYRLIILLRTLGIERSSKKHMRQKKTKTWKKIEFFRTTQKLGGDYSIQRSQIRSYAKEESKKSFYVFYVVNQRN